MKIINDTVCNVVTEGQVTSRMLCSGFLSGGVDACQVGGIRMAGYIIILHTHTHNTNTCNYKQKHMSYTCILKHS